MSQSNTQNSKFRSIWGIGLVLILLFISGLYYTNTLVGIEQFSNYISLPIYMIIPGILLILGILAITRAKKIVELPKISLVFLVLSFSFFLAAEQTWNLYEHVLDIDPYPSIADLFYLGAPIFMFISLLLFLRPFRNHISKKNIAFATAISATLLIPTVIATYNIGAEDEPFEILVALMYPIVDSLLLVPAIIAILFSVMNKRNFFWIMILAGIIILIAADTIFLFLIIDDSYVDGHPVDVLWVSSYTVWAFMMYYIIHNSKHQKEEDDNKFKIEKVEKFGILIGLVLINVSIGIALISMNYFMDINSGDNVLSYFSWFLIIIVIIFSSVVLFLNSKINKTLGDRTAKLEKVSEELIKAERFSAIGSLAARLSHDLRNPLSVIVGSNTIIQGETSSEKILKNTDRIDRASKRIEHQVNNVLDFIRIKPPIIKQESLDKLIDNVLNSLDIPSGISIEKQSTSIDIPCDKEQFSIILINILSNAIQKLEDKGSISIICDNDDSNYIIKIQDSGESISKDNMEKIFEPLFTTKEHGTGLGLASCKQIMRQHKGEIYAENNPTTFVVKVPKELQ